MQGKKLLAAISHDAGCREKLIILELEEENPELRQLTTADTGDVPTSVCSSGDGRYLYITDDVQESSPKKTGPGGMLRTFTFDREQEILHQVGEIATGGAGPGSVTESFDGRYCIVSHYRGGVVTVLELDRQGLPSRIVHKTRLVGFGPNRHRQQGAHPSSVVFAPDDRFMYVPDVGSDRIWIFQLTDTGGLRTPADPAVIMPPGSGPRALHFDQATGIAYCLNELGSSIVSFIYDPDSGMLHPKQGVSTLPSGYTGPNTGGDLYVDQGDIIVLNQGHNSLMRISSGSEGFSGKPEWVDAGGEYPHALTGMRRRESGKGWLVTANRHSDSLVLFSHEAHSLLPVLTFSLPEPAGIRFISP